MSDIYMPGLRSRFNTDRMVDDLMRVERVPLERAQRETEQLQSQKTWWQDIGRRMTTLRDSARFLFSFQNPFSERVVHSADESVISGTATRQAMQQERSFQVGQLASADRFLSEPLEDNFRVDAGNYTFTVGNREVSFNFRGGSLREFTDVLNRRGRNTIQASVINIERNSRSLLVESLLTGEENRLGFKGDAERLATAAGMVERQSQTRYDVDLNNLRIPDESVQLVTAENGVIWVGAGGSVTVPFQQAVPDGAAWVLSFEAATEILSSENGTDPLPPPGPDIPSAGSVTYGSITIDNSASQVTLPVRETPEQPARRDTLSIISLVFDDGSTAPLPPVHDSRRFDRYRYPLQELSGGRAVAGLLIQNGNTHRDISVKNIVIQDPQAAGDFRPVNAASIAQDALFNMDGIEIRRSANTVDDLIPGVTLNLQAASDRPVRLGIEPDRETIKEAIITLVGNYNRLMAELNVLTRRDDRIVQDLNYLSADEEESYRQRLGVFAADSTLGSLRNSLQRSAAAPYLTELGGDLILLRQIGIGTDLRGAGASAGYDPARLRGYLEIDETALNAALQNRMTGVQQLFGYDTDGDLLVDSGLAYSIDQLVKPYVETGGIVSLKTGSIDSRLSRDNRRVETLERQLAARETALRTQFNQMESAYSRMEQMSTSLDNFNRQANANNNRN